MRDAAAWRRLFTAVSSGLRGIRTAPVIFTTTVATMTAGLLVLGSCGLVVQNMRGTLERYGDEFSVYAFLPPKLDPDPARIADLERRLGALDGVEDVLYVSRAEALERLRIDLGDDVDVLQGLEVNPLPASFELRLKVEARSPALVRTVAKAAQKVEGIDEARYGEEWVGGYASMLRVVEVVGLVLAIGIFLMLSVIVGGTVRLAVYARADEIEIQRLVGAGSLYVRLPFYIQGALQGGIGAIVSTLILYGLYRITVPIFGGPLQLLLGSSSLVFLGSFEIALLMFVGVGLGLAGSAVWLLRLEET